MVYSENSVDGAISEAILCFIVMWERYFAKEKDISEIDMKILKLLI